MTSLRLAIFALVTVLALSIQPVYGTSNKACDIWASIEFDAENRTASYTITVNARTRPLTADFVVEINDDFKRATFENVSIQDQIFRAEIDGRTLSAIDITGPDKFPFDRYRLHFIIHLPFDSESYCDVNPPTLKGPLMQADRAVLRNTTPVEVSIELFRSPTWQLIVMGSAFAPLVGIPILGFSKKKDSSSMLRAISPTLPGGVAYSVLEYSLHWIPSRNTFSCFELVFFASFMVLIASIAVVLWRRRRSA